MGSSSARAGAADAGPWSSMRARRAARPLGSERTRGGVAPIEQRFLVDGRWVDGAECRRLFDGPLPDRMRQVLRRARGPRLLDVGCYDASFLDLLGRERPDVDAVATDYDDENLRIASFLRPALRSRLVRASVYGMPFPDESFDCITFQEVIEHLEGAAQAVKEINRLLRAGGSLVLSTPNAYYWRDLLRQVRGELPRLFGRHPRPLASAVFFAESEWNRHIYCWTPSTLMTLLEVNGFEYVWHGYSRDTDRHGRTVTRIAPFFGSVMVFEVRKVGPAPPRLI